MTIDLNCAPLLPYSAILKDKNQKSRAILRKKSAPFTFPLSNEDKEKLKEIATYLDEGYDEEYATKWDIRPAVGLALPQIGYLKRGFAIRAHDEEGEEISFIALNPVIISTSLEQTYLGNGEGCLSVEKNIQGLVMRARRITARFTSYDIATGDLHEETRRFHDLLSVIFQHEADHLDGILFYDHIDRKDPYHVPANAREVAIRSK